MSDDKITLYYCPNTRAGSTRVLLEELGAPYELVVMDMKAGEHLGEAFRAVNPMAKVPAIRHKGVVITEQVAIYLYLCDQFPEKELAPALDDPLRGAYLRWMVFYAACFEPAMVDHALKREPGARGMVPYGDFDSVIDTLAGQVRAGPHFLGEPFTALDLLWGSAIRQMMQWKILPERPEFTAYVARLGTRTIAARLTQEAEAMAAAQEAARKKA